MVGKESLETPPGRKVQEKLNSIYLLLCSACISQIWFCWLKNFLLLQPRIPDNFKALFLLRLRELVVLRRLKALHFILRWPRSPRLDDHWFFGWDKSQKKQYCFDKILRWKLFWSLRCRGKSRVFWRRGWICCALSLAGEKNQRWRRGILSQVSLKIDTICDNAHLSEAAKTLQLKTNDIWKVLKKFNSWLPIF